ncbi:GNAT family N-acetyltransferase [Pedobacter sp. UC225_65]|uniref:GNAT family N-acetyltransferase n=1 Tax=Pedobacter sp. UC225_65 TaxID=3350173 RepID=UPI00366EACB4
MNIEIRRLTPAEAHPIAALHYSAFKGFFLTSLGQPFLKEFYKAVLMHKNGIGFGAFAGNDLVGFAIGTQQNTGFYSDILKTNGVGLLLKALPKLIAQPKGVFRLVKSFGSKVGTTYQHVPMLLSICVDQAKESKGIGKNVLVAFEKELIKLAYDCLILSTDTHDNFYANQFYHKNNYTFVKSFFQGKREMNLYYKKLIT